MNANRCQTASAKGSRRNTSWAKASKARSPGLGKTSLKRKSRNAANLKEKRCSQQWVFNLSGFGQVENLSYDPDRQRQRRFPHGQAPPRTAAPPPLLRRGP